MYSMLSDIKMEHAIATAIQKVMKLEQRMQKFHIPHCSPENFVSVNNHNVTMLTVTLAEMENQKSVTTKMHRLMNNMVNKSQNNALYNNLKRREMEIKHLRAG